MMSQNSLSAIVVIIALIAAVSDAHPPRKIVGGQTVVLGEFPYQVSVHKNGWHHCGGSIISNGHVITAAHCVCNVPINQIVIVTGLLRRNNSQNHTIAIVHCHSEYTTDGLMAINDIAILVLNRDIIFNDYQDKVALPNGPTPNGVTANVTGWGSNNTYSESPSNNLMKITVTTMTVEKCQNYFDSFNISYPAQICAMGDAETGVCHNDSGGPLVSNGTLIGVISFGIPCAAGYPDIYTNVYHNINWIRRIIDHRRIILPKIEDISRAISNSYIRMLFKDLYTPAANNQPATNCDQLNAG